MKSSYPETYLFSLKNIYIKYINIADQYCSDNVLLFF